MFVGAVRSCDLKVRLALWCTHSRSTHIARGGSRGSGTSLCAVAGRLASVWYSNIDCLRRFTKQRRRVPLQRRERRLPGVSHTFMGAY